MFDEWIDNNRIRSSTRDIIAHLLSLILFIHLFFYLLLSFSWHFPPCSLHQQRPYSSSMFVHQSLFSLSAFLSSPLVRVSTFKICSRLPRRDVDARYSGYRVTSCSQCSEINSSGKMLLVVRPLSPVHLSFNLHLSLSSLLARGDSHPIRRLLCHGQAPKQKISRPI